MIYGAILAGGSGSRMGSADLPKQFMTLDGVPVIVHSIRTFTECGLIDRLLILVPEQWTEYTRELIDKYTGEGGAGADANACGSIPVRVIAGGATRTDTLVRAVAYAVSDTAASAAADTAETIPAADIPVIQRAASDLASDVIMVTHDAARPFVTVRMIRDNIEAAEKYGACTAAFPATDTIARSADGEFISEMTDRREMYCVQTPQSFRAGRFMELFAALSDEEKEKLTDAAGLFSMKGDRVSLAAGSSGNIKITYPGDIEAAEMMLRQDHPSRHSRPAGL